MRLAGERASGRVGPGRKEKLVTCAYCGEPLGRMLVRPSDPPACCGSASCREEEAMDQSGDEQIERGVWVR